MDAFVVSARKYRPATFDMVVGQQSITGTLKNAIRNQQLAQAFLFCGPRGVGKTTCARILAKTINCQNLGPETEPCNACDSCLSFSRSASFNVYELDAASNNSVEDIRSLVDQVRIPPQGGKYKVYIIDEVHMLSLAAFNAFLKTLEEPPPYAKFILATTEKHKIIPTILSRCQIFDFKRIMVEDIAHHLAYVAEKEGVNAEFDALHVIAVKADGSLRDALSIFDQLVSFSGSELKYQDVIANLNVLDYDYYFRMTDHMIEGDIRSALLLVHEVTGNGFDGQHFLIGLAEHLRNLLVATDDRTAPLLEVTEGYKQKYLAQAKASSVPFLLAGLEVTSSADMNYKAASNKQLHLELAAIKLCRLQGVGNAEAQKKTPDTGYATGVTASRPVPPPAPVRTPEPQRPTPIPQRQREEKPSVTTPPSTGKAKIGLGLPNSIASQGSISLKADEEEGQDEDPSLLADQELPETSFREEDLQMYWQAFAGRLRDDKPSVFTMLTTRKPSLGDGWVVKFEVDNRVQQAEMEALRADLLEYLRKQLDNSRISLQLPIVKRENGDVRPYTPQEKFRYLSEQNPALKELRDRLDLDIDY
jgi:DNA polymerase-3 subunit gamma/tau